MARALKHWMYPTLSLVVAMCVVSGCQCQGEGIAELFERSGNVEADDAKAEQAWMPADVGRSFQLGEAVRTRRDAHARLKLRNGSRLRLEAETMIRFRSRADDEAAFSVETGLAEVETGAEGISFETVEGLVRLEREGRARVSMEADGSARIEVLFGQGEVMPSGGGAAITLGEGDSFSSAEDVGIQAPTPDAGIQADAGPPPVASERISIEVSRSSIQMRTPDGQVFEPFAVGKAEVEAGSRLRVGPRAVVRVQRGSENALIRGVADVVVGADSGALIDASSGRVELGSDEGAMVRVTTPGGAIVTRPGVKGTRALVAVGARSTEIDTARGEIEVHGAEGVTRLRAGETARLSRSGQVDVSYRNPERADLRVNAGESATIHDPRPPTAVEIAPGDTCPGPVAIELGRGGFRPRAVGEPPLIVELSPGRTPYRLRCVEADGSLGAPQRGGNLSVIRDRANRPLSKTSTRNTVEVDGRRYTILYQHVLPTIALRWPQAPKAPGYEVQVISDAGRTWETGVTRPQAELPRAFVGEHTYRIRFTAKDAANTRSRETLLAIKFDNAAPWAYLDVPPVLTPVEGRVRLRGVALAGSRASAADDALALDGQSRFDGWVRVPPKRRGLGIRIAHPSHGIHYYVRRIAQTEDSE